MWAQGIWFISRHQSLNSIKVSRITEYCFLKNSKNEKPLLSCKPDEVDMTTSAWCVSRIETCLQMGPWTLYLGRDNLCSVSGLWQVGHPSFCQSQQSRLFIVCVGPQKYSDWHFWWITLEGGTWVFWENTHANMRPVGTELSAKKN
jgi:hypothetical protein